MIKWILSIIILGVSFFLLSLSTLSFAEYYTSDSKPTYYLHNQFNVYPNHPNKQTAKLKSKDVNRQNDQATGDDDVWNDVDLNAQY
jgi:hypothetical protein